MIPLSGSRVYSNRILLPKAIALTQRVVCLPNGRKALHTSLVVHKLGVVVHTCRLALGRWRQGQQKFKVILGLSETTDYPTRRGTGAPLQCACTRCLHDFVNGHPVSKRRNGLQSSQALRTRLCTPPPSASPPHSFPFCFLKIDSVRSRARCLILDPDRAT